MNNMVSKIARRQRRRNRIRTKIGTSGPRLVVSLSNLHASAQVVDGGKTLLSSTSRGQKLSAGLGKRAEWVGMDIAKKAKSAKITKVVFDRGAKLYHGRIKVLAEAARQNGLKF